MLERRIVVGVYALVGAISAAVALAFDHDPLRTRALVWPELPPVANDGLSLLFGLVLAGVGIGSARFFVSRFTWARALQAELAPVVRGTSDRDLLIAALASGIAEELLFRGLLLQVVGIVLSSLFFGAVHQVRGPARWAWIVWATLMGALLGGIFVATGSLLGPVVAHVLTNAVNLKFVRDHGAPTPPRTLASLLSR